MNIQRIVGVVLLAVGAILLILGMNASDSIADQMSRVFTGRLTDGTTWSIVGGIAFGALGLLMVAFGRRGKLA